MLTTSILTMETYYSQYTSITKKPSIVRTFRSTSEVPKNWSALKLCFLLWKLPPRKISSSKNQLVFFDAHKSFEWRTPVFSIWASALLDIYQRPAVYSSGQYFVVICWWRKTSFQFLEFQWWSCTFLQLESSKRNASKRRAYVFLLGL